MISEIIAFGLGVISARIFLARVKPTDWMQSTGWIKHPWWKWFHRHVLCELCPKRHYCNRYLNQKIHEWIGGNRESKTKGKKA